MKFFEGFRRRENEQLQASEEKIGELQRNIVATVAERDNALRKLNYTMKFNDESRSDVREKIGLEIKRDLIKANLDRARKHRAHLVQMTQSHAELIEAEATLAKFKGESPPSPPENIGQRETVAREEVKELESQFADIEGQLGEIHTRMSAREQQLRKESGLSKD